MSDATSPAARQTDLAHDVLRQERQALDMIFAPRNVAVIGATETPNSVGRTVLWNLISNPFGGTVFHYSSEGHHAIRLNDRDATTIAG